ncbi:hypothetical protein [Clostridium disporicum]|uniref:hypothetical protein n=1 Tax=Clostridium disporicum TaxID=84024 RepID=UPI0034A54204
MDKYNLQPNEYFILNNEHVYHGNTIGELILTNLNLVHITSKGIFKTTYIPKLYPINQIKVFNGKAQVILREAGKIDIHFINGMESFKFINNDALFNIKKAEKEASRWVNAMNQLITGQVSESDTLVSSEVTSTEVMVGAIKDTFDTVKGVFGIKPKSEKSSKESEKVVKKCSYCGAPISGTKGQVVSCEYCDAEQQL